MTAMAPVPQNSNHHAHAFSMTFAVSAPRLSHHHPSHAIVVRLTVAFTHLLPSRPIDDLALTLVLRYNMPPELVICLHHRPFTPLLRHVFPDFCVFLVHSF